MGKREDFVTKLFLYINREETRQQFQNFVIDPLLNHVLERVFPYILLTCVLFLVLIVVVMLTLGIVIFQLRKGIVYAPISATGKM
jgi:hypothetical protein